MRRAFQETALIAAILVLAFILPNPTFALPSKGDPGHSSLTEMSANIKLRVHKDDATFIQSFEKNIPRMRDANVAEDDLVGGGLIGARHFYDPDNGNGYLGIFQNAKDSAHL